VPKNTKGLYVSFPLIEHVTEDQVSKMECKCKKCEEDFVTAVDLNEHLASCLDTPKNFKCKLCNTTEDWHSDIALRKHIGESHQKDRGVCKVCGLVVIAQGWLKTHMKRVHPVSGTPETFTCDRCGRALASKYDLRMHIMALHENNRPHKCPDCDQRFVTPDLMLRHRHSKHIRETVYKCPHCSYFTYLAGVIPKHILEVHDRAKPHKCDYCDHEGFFYLRDKRKHYMSSHPEHAF
jgi:hypothetical protein